MLSDEMKKRSHQGGGQRKRGRKMRKEREGERERASRT